MRLRKLAALCFGGLLTAVLSIGLSATAHASDPTVPSATWNEIFIPFDNAAGNQLYVDVPDGSTAPGLALQFYSCHGYSSGGGPQPWYFDPLGDDLVTIRNINSNLCISSPQNAALASGIRLVQGPCGDLNALWSIRAQNDNGTDPLIEITKIDNQDGPIAFSNNLCMAAGNMGDNNHTPLVATTCQPLQSTPADLSQVLELA